MYLVNELAGKLVSRCREFVGRTHIQYKRWIYLLALKSEANSELP